MEGQSCPFCGSPLVIRRRSEGDEWCLVCSSRTTVCKIPVLIFGEVNGEGVGRVVQNSWSPTNTWGANDNG